MRIIKTELAKYKSQGSILGQTKMGVIRALVYFPLIMREFILDVLRLRTSRINFDSP